MPVNSTQFDKRTLILIIITLFLLVTLPIALFVSRQRQETRQRASAPGGVAEVRLNPSTTTGITIGQTVPVEIKIKSNSTTDKLISGLRVVISLTYSGTSPFAPLTTSNIVKGYPDDTDGNWTFMKEVSADGKTITINSVYLNSSGYDIGTEKTVGTINFTAQNTGSVTVNFDASLSKIISKIGTNTDILTTPPSPAGTYTVGGGSTPPAGASPTPTGTIAPTPTATVIPTPTVTRPPTAPIITRLSNYCGTISSAESESVLVLYGSKFGATRSTSKVTFHYKSNSVAKDDTYVDKDVTDYVSWSDSVVVVKVPAVTFPKDSAGVDKASVVAKVVLTTTAEPNWPFTFPALDNFAFFEITHVNPKNIGDVNCSGWVNLRDYSILFNNYDKNKELEN